MGHDDGEAEGKAIEAWNRRCDACAALGGEL